MNNTEAIVTIEKEAISELRFPEQEVLISQDAISNRRYEAERGTKLGNYFKDKVKIVFEDSKGMKMVETTIWGLTDKRILLKGDIAVPLHRIHEIII